MLKRLDIVRILSVCVCLCHVCPASPCGGNPMRSVENFARNNGFESSARVLHFMRQNTPSDYSSFMQEYRRYLDCTQMVQNGYFKRSADYSMDDAEVTSSEYSNDRQTLDKREGNRIEQNLVSATVEAQPKLGGSSSLVRAEFKRKWEESRQRVDPKWRNDMAVQLHSLLDDRTSSALKRILHGLHDGSKLVNPDSVYKKSNLYTEINSRRR